MLLILDFQRVGTGAASTRIPKALRFVLYVYKYQIIISKKELYMDYENLKHVYKQEVMRYSKQIK